MLMPAQAVQVRRPATQLRFEDLVRFRLYGRASRPTEAGTWQTHSWRFPMAIQIGKTLAFTAVGGLVAGLVGCAGSDQKPADGAPAATGDAAAAPAAKDCCKGKNSCKGKGGCKNETNDCKGKNDCGGKGGCKTRTDC
jgi:hypothetical protein